MANEFPCPACGDENADLYHIAERPEGFDGAHPSSGCVYACATCISDARMIRGVLVAPQSNDITAEDHQ